MATLTTTFTTAFTRSFAAQGHPCEEEVIRLSWYTTCGTLMMLAVLNIVVVAENKRRPKLEEPLLDERGEDSDVEHPSFDVDRSDAEPLRLQDFVYQSIPAVVPGLLFCDLVRYLVMPWSLLSTSGSMWDKMERWDRRMGAVREALAVNKLGRQFRSSFPCFISGCNFLFPFLVQLTLLIMLFGSHLYGERNPHIAWPPRLEELVVPMIALISNWLLTSFGAQYGIINENGHEATDRILATDRVELAILVRLKSLSVPLHIKVDNEYKQLVKHKGKFLKKEYQNAVCEGKVPPIELAHQMRSGFLYPAGNDPLLKAMAAVSYAVKWLLDFINILWFVGLALLPNLFRPGWDKGRDGWKSLCHLTFQFPGCVGGWICYMVFLMSIGMPGANLSMLIDSLQSARRMHWRQCSAAFALTTMLKGEKANRWLLPSVRMDNKYDLLVWSELCDLIDHQSRSAKFRLTEIVLIFSVLWIVTMISVTAYNIWQDPHTLRIHVLGVCYALYTAFYVTFQVTRTMIAGVCVNGALHARLSAIAEIVYRQRLMEAHGYVTGCSAAGNEGQNIRENEAIGNEDSMQQPAATGRDQNDLMIQEFKSTMLFAEAVLQRLARKRGFVRLLCLRLEAYSIIPGLLSGWGVMAKLAAGFDEAKLK